MRITFKDCVYNHFDIDSFKTDNYYEELNNLKDYIKEKSEFIRKLEDFQKAVLTDEEFYKEAKEIYDIEFSNQDLLKMSSKILGEDVVERTLKTSIIDCNLEASHPVFITMPQYFYLDVSIACAKSALEEINLNYKYSASELTNLVKNRKIVILNHFMGTKPRYFYSISISKQILRSKSYSLKKLELSSNNNENYAVYGAALREVLTPVKLQKDYKLLNYMLQKKLEKLRWDAISNQIKYTSMVKAYMDVAEICEESEILKKERNK